MLTIQIQDEQLVQQLQQMADRERRPVEELLKTMVSRYAAEGPTESSPPSQEEKLNRIRRKAYAKARAYWQSVGDVAKAALTDEELYEQFGAFDPEGIPRLKSELPPGGPPVGSLAYAAKVIEENGGIHSGESLDATQADEILNAEFADYLLRRMNSNDATP